VLSEDKRALAQEQKTALLFPHSVRSTFKSEET